LRELGNRADRPLRRSASGGRFRKPGTDGDAWFAGDAARGNGNATRQYRNTAGRSRNPSGRNCHTARDYRDAANHSGINIAGWNSEYNRARFEHTDGHKPGKHNAAVKR
jgi:hypothetical protein